MRKVLRENRFFNDFQKTAMSIEQAERLKKEWTDKFVVVDDNVPELRRFAGRTGKVKTVNMSCRALVEFLDTEDIGWYDIDPAYLTVVEEPAVKAPAKAEKPAPAAKAAKPAAAKAGKSPLELARQQGAAKPAGQQPAAARKPAAKKKLSPLELARMQDAKKGAPATAAKAPSQPQATAPQATAPQAATSAEAPPPKKKLSPLELARMQDGGKQPDESSQTASAVESEQPPAQPSGRKLSKLELARMQDAKNQSAPAASPAEQPEEETAPSAAQQKPQASATGPDGRKLSKIELARMQDSKK